MKELEELTQEIREKLPRLKEVKKQSYIGGCNIMTLSAPMLNDVLDYLTIIDLDNVSVEFSNQEFFILKYNEPVQYFDDWDDCNCEGKSWDLSKPYLKDQSPELITFLHSLIKTKQ